MGLLKIVLKRNLDSFKNVLHVLFGERVACCKISSKRKWEKLQSYITGGLHLMVDILILAYVVVLLSFFLVAIYYKSAIAHDRLIVPAAFKYEQCSLNKACSGRKATFSYNYIEDPAFVLGDEVRYSILLELVTADNNDNYLAGMFQIRTQGKRGGKNSYNQFNNEISFMFPYVSYIINMYKTIIKTPFILTGFMEEKQTITIEIAEFIQKRHLPLMGMDILIKSDRINFYHSNVIFQAKLEGCQYYLYYYPLSTCLALFCSLVSLFTFLLGILASFDNWKCNDKKCFFKLRPLSWILLKLGTENEMSQNLERNRKQSFDEINDSVKNKSLVEQQQIILPKCVLDKLIPAIDTYYESSSDPERKSEKYFSELQDLLVRNELNEKTDGTSELDTEKSQSVQKKDFIKESILPSKDKKVYPKKDSLIRECNIPDEKSAADGFHEGTSVSGWDSAPHETHDPFEASGSSHCDESTNREDFVLHEESVPSGEFLPFEDSVSFKDSSSSDESVLFDETVSSKESVLSDEPVSSESVLSDEPVSSESVLSDEPVSSESVLSDDPVSFEETTSSKELVSSGEFASYSKDSFELVDVEDLPH